MEIEDIIDDFIVKMENKGILVEPRITLNTYGEFVAVKFEVIGRVE